MVSTQAPETIEKDFLKTSLFCVCSYIRFHIDISLITSIHAHAGTHSPSAGKQRKPDGDAKI